MIGQGVEYEMGHSITSYKGKNIISKDYKIEIWFKYICKEIDKIDKLPKWLAEAKRYWKDQVSDYSVGCIDVQLDKFLLNEEEKLLFIKICENIYNKLSKFGDIIPKEVINTIGEYEFPFEVRENVKVEHYLSYGRALIRLIKGEQKKEVEYI